MTVVPTFTQNSAFPLASVILGVAEAELLVRLTFTTQGIELDPQVVFMLQPEEQAEVPSVFS
jgi:hypothetical protein